MLIGLINNNLAQKVIIYKREKSDKLHYYGVIELTITIVVLPPSKSYYLQNEICDSCTCNHMNC